MEEGESCIAKFGCISGFHGLDENRICFGSVLGDGEWSIGEDEGEQGDENQR